MCTLLCAAVSLHPRICTCILGIHGGPSSNLVSPSHQWTPLHKAARGGHTDTVKYIIQAGADFTIKDNYGVSE